MKKYLFIVWAVIGLVFVSCNKEDDRDTFAGSYLGKVTMKGTKVVDDGEPQSVTQSMTGYFTIAKDGNEGSRVTVKIVGVDYGNLTGSVDGNTLTIDALHTTVTETVLGTKKTTDVDLVFQPAQINDGHIVLNGSLHTLTTSVTLAVTSKEDLQSALLIEADKQ